MGRFDRLFGEGSAAPEFPEQAVIAAAGTRDFDGNEIAVDLADGMFWMYGPDADALCVSVKPARLASSFMRGAGVTLRYGPPADGVREVELQLPRA